MTVSTAELWELHRIDHLVKDRGISEEDARKIVKAEIEAGLCPYLGTDQAAGSGAH